MGWEYFVDLLGKTLLISRNEPVRELLPVKYCVPGNVAGLYNPIREILTVGYSRLFYTANISRHTVLFLCIHVIIVIIEFSGENPNFFRMMCTAPHGTEEDMKFILDEIHRLGKDL